MVKPDRKKPKPAIDLPNYVISKKVGEGTYGVVWRATNKATNTTVALKCIKLEGETQGFPSTTLREITFLKSLSHPNIIQLHDVIPTRSYLYLVFEFMDKDLRNVIEADDGTFVDLPAKTIKSYCYQMLLGIEYCHSRQIMHRDLKPQNVLVDRNGTVKLADFGLARAVTLPLRAYTHEVVTLWYRAPEILLGTKRYCFAVDMWSFGCMCAEMVGRRTIFRGDAEIDQLFRIFRVLGTPNDANWPGVSALPHFQAVFPRWTAPSQGAVRVELERARGGTAQLEGALGGRQQAALVVDLLEELFVYSPASRLTAQGALRHGYFDELRNNPSLIPSAQCSHVANETTDGHIVASHHGRFSLPGRLPFNGSVVLNADANCNFTSTLPCSSSFAVPMRTAFAVPAGQSAALPSRAEDVHAAESNDLCSTSVMNYFNRMANCARMQTHAQSQQQAPVAHVSQCWPTIHANSQFGSTGDLNSRQSLPYAMDLVTPVATHNGYAVRDSSGYMTNDTALAGHEHVSSLQSRIVLLPATNRQSLPSSAFLIAPNQMNSSGEVNFSANMQQPGAPSRKRTHEQLEMVTSSQLDVAPYSRASMPFVGGAYVNNQLLGTAPSGVPFSFAYAPSTDASFELLPSKMRRL